MNTARPTNLFLFPGYVLCFGRFSDNTTRTHHSIQITIGLEQDFSLYYDNEWHSLRSAIVAPDMPHKLHSPAGLVMLMLFDTETETAKKLMTRYLESTHVSPLDAVMQQYERIRVLAGRNVSSCSEGRRSVSDILDVVLGSAAAKANGMDERIQKAIDMIQRLHEGNDVRCFAIYDANFALDPHRVTSICREIDKRNLRIIIDLPTGLPIHEAVDEVLDALASVGLIRTCISV